jgi:hypothetical protein
MIPIAACGGGRHHVIDTADLAGAAAVYLMYNGSTDCVVRWKTKFVGTKTYTDALIWSGDDSLSGDPRSYAYYAGPVKVTAPGTCITWGGDATASDGVHSFRSG